MSESKHTPWFPENVKPAREGVYQVKVRHSTYYSYYSKSGWHGDWFTAEHAKKHSSWMPVDEHRRWRGLTRPAT